MKVFIKTFGCRANQYDSERLRAIALDSGAEIVDSAATADVAVFNSCAVTTDAEADLRQSIRRAARQNPAMRSFVMGCASSLEVHREAESKEPGPGIQTIRSLPTVEEIFTGAAIDGVAAAIGLRPAARGRHGQTGARALLRIQDGCDEHCTFCATTLARGSSRSRSVNELVDEANALAEYHPEIVVTGVHIGSYGVDIGTTLSALVETLMARVPAVRLRLSSLEATEVDGRLLELLTSAPRQLAPYLHAPLQSGSDRILKRMGRHWYTAREYREVLEKIVSRTTVFGLGADVIAGFPGETDSDHQATVDLIASLPFSSLHVFPYSPRPGTAALKLQSRVAADVISARAGELRELARKKANEYARSRADSTADVIIVRGGISASNQAARTGLTEDYLTVHVAGTEPRGSRFNARLTVLGDALVATRIT